MKEYKYDWTLHRTKELEEKAGYLMILPEYDMDGNRFNPPIGFQDNEIDDFRLSHSKRLNKLCY